MVLNAHRRRDHKRTNRTRVHLDGVYRPDCFYADGRRGVVREYVREHGDLFINEDGQYLLKQELRGHVTWVVV